MVTLGLFFFFTVFVSPVFGNFFGQVYEKATLQNFEDETLFSPRYFPPGVLFSRTEKKGARKAKTTSEKCLCTPTPFVISLFFGIGGRRDITRLLDSLLQHCGQVTIKATPLAGRVD